VKELEQYIFRKFPLEETDIPLVFILGPPRTGSTLLYQLLVNFFGLFYFSNLVNDFFSEHPVIGAIVQQAFRWREVSYESKQGKTAELFEPSEASLIFKNWFGSQHPSQTKSCDVIVEKKSHMIGTMSAIYQITCQPILIKNAWNCFRIRSLVEMFPASKFIWIRRDLVHSADSDLKTRLARGSLDTWSSATTANYEEIQRRPHGEQVVLQQYEYSKAIANDLKQFVPRFLEVRYEDLCTTSSRQLDRLGKFLGMTRINGTVPELKPSVPTSIDDEILAFVNQNLDKFRPFLKGSCP